MISKNVLMIIAPVNFRDEELLEPKRVLESAGAKVTIASKGVKVAKGALGATVNVDLDIVKANPEDYDAIVFVGGMGSSIYFVDAVAQSMARQAYEKGKIVAAICIAPSTLANAGLLKGKRATAYPSAERNLRSKGAIYTGEGVTQDGKIITAKGPQFAKDFGEAILKNLR